MDEHEFDDAFDAITSSPELQDLYDTEIPHIALYVELPIAVAAVEARNHVADHVCPEGAIYLSQLMHAFVDELEQRLTEFRNGSDPE